MSAKKKSRYFRAEFGGFDWRANEDTNSAQLNVIKVLGWWRKGTHHFYGTVEPCGPDGVALTTRITIASYDSDELTWLVLLAHENLVRVEVSACAPGYLKIYAHQRKQKAPDDYVWDRHPNIGDLINRAIKLNNQKEVAQ